MATTPDNARGSRSALAHVEALYGGDDLHSPRAVAEYINQLRRADRAAANEIHDAAEMLHQIIIDSAEGIPGLFGLDVRRRARRICEPLYEAGNAHDAAASLSVLTWQRFHHQFSDLIEATRKASGRGRKTMDWKDS